MAKLKKENLIEGWKIIVKYLRPHREAVFLLSILSIVSAISSAAVPYLAGKIVDTIKTSEVFYFIFAWLILRSIGSAMDWRSWLLNNKLQGVLESEYLARGYGKLLELP